MITCQKYVGHEVLGIGCSSLVCRASNQENYQEGALKIINIDKANEFKHFCFRNEVAILQNLDHPNVVKMVDYAENITCTVSGQEETKLTASYIALENGSQGDLFLYLEKTGKFGEETSRYLFHQLIEALEYLHNKGISHCDIKPENIMFDDDYTVKLVDFGFSTFKKESCSMTGTFEYMLPEILTQQPYKCKEADIFAVGIVLFNLMTQHPPFHSANLNDKFYQLLVNGQHKKFWKAHSKAMKSSKFFSKEFKFLINSMFSDSTSQRLSISEIKQTEWFNGPLPPKEEYLIEMTFRRKIINHLLSTPDDPLGTSST